MPEWISRVAKLSGELALQVLGDCEHRHGGDEALVLCGVERLQSVVLDLGSRDVETIRDSHGQIVENLVTVVLATSHEGIVQWPLKADLTHEGVLRNLAGNATRGSNHPWQAGGNANAGRGSRRRNRGVLLNDAGEDGKRSLGVGRRGRNSTDGTLRASGRWCCGDWD